MFAVMAFAVKNPKLVALPDATLSVFRFEYPRTFEFPVKIRLDVLREFATARLVNRPTEVMLGWAGFVTLEATLAAATLPTRFDEFKFEIAEPLEATKRPLIVRPVKVPTDVMLGWEGFVTLEATLAAATLPTRFDEFRFEIAEPLEATKRPLIVRPVKVPTDMIFGWEGFVTLEATLAAATFPTRFEEFRFEIAEPSEATKRPLIVRPVKVPTDVIFGWEGFVTLEATLAAETLPTRFEEFRFERPEAFPTRRPPLKIPVTVRATMFAVVMTLMFEQSKLETAPFAALRKPVFEVLVLRTLKKAVLAPSPPVMLAVVNQALATLAVPDTLRFTRVPREVIFDWVFESWREVRGLMRFAELRLESPDAFPMYN